MRKQPTVSIPHRSSRGLPRSAQSGAPLAGCVKRTTVESTSRLKLTKPFKAGTWNIRSLLGIGATRLLVAEIEKARVDIMGLQEVLWPDAGQVSVANHSILWSGPPEGAIRQAGVALVLNKMSAAALLSWNPVSERLLFAKFKHRFGSLTVIVAYAPTNEADEDVKGEFYQSLG